MELTTLSKMQRSLDITSKVADNNKPLEDGKEYPINLSLLGADGGIETFSGSVTFQNGVGRVSNNLYEHLGMGATLKNSSDGQVSLEGKNSQTFAVSSNYNGINIIGKEKDEREEEQIFDDHTTPSKDNINLKNVKNQKNARANLVNNSAKQTRQMVQDLRAMSNEFVLDQRKNFIRNVPKLMYLIELLETRNYQKAHNKVEREHITYSSALVTASKVEDFHRKFHKTIDSILGHEQKVCHDCQQQTRNSAGLTKNDVANFVFSTITKFQEKYKEQYPDRPEIPFEELQRKIFPHISWNVLEYLQQQAALDSGAKTKTFKLAPNNDKNLRDRLLGKHPDGSNRTVIYKTPRSDHRKLKCVKFGDFLEKHKNEPETREPETTIDERQQRKISKCVNTLETVKEDKKETNQAETPSAEASKNGTSKQKSFRLVNVTKEPIIEVRPENEFDFVKDKVAIASLGTTLATTTITPQQEDGFVKNNPPTSNNSQQNENNQNPETSAEASEHQPLNNINFESYDGHTAFDWDKIASDMSFNEHEHTHHHHESEMASKLEDLASQIETMIQRHGDELDKLDSNLDEFTFRIVWEHRKFAPEEMKNELHAYSDILSADKKLTPAQRKRELHIKREQIQARQNKVFEEKLAMQKKYQGMEYAKKLKKQAEERTALIKKLLELEKEQYKKTTIPCHAPVLGDETQKALEHMQEEMLQAMTVLDNKIETLKTTGNWEEAQSLAQEREDMVRKFTRIRNNCGRDRCPLSKAILRERGLEPSSQYTTSENVFANHKRKGKCKPVYPQQKASIRRGFSQPLSGSQRNPNGQSSSTSTSSAENDYDMFSTESTATSAYTHTNNVDYLAVLNPNNLHNAEAIYGVKISPELLEEIKSITPKPLSREDFLATGSLREQYRNKSRIDTTRLREYFDSQAGPNGPANH